VTDTARACARCPGRQNPLFNLSGQVVDLSIGYGSGAGYAVPIDDAPQLARQLAGQ